MKASVGLRVYNIKIIAPANEKQTRATNGPSDLYAFLKKFVTSSISPNMNHEKQRSWFFSSTFVESNKGRLYGLLKYGAYGYESDIVDGKTRQRKLRRSSDDIDEIPLFYDFDVTVPKNGAFLALQSYKGRSCNSLILNAIETRYVSEFPNYKLSIKKIMPADLLKVFKNFPVKSVTLASESVPSDLADSYLTGMKVNEARYEVKVIAERKGFLCNVSDLFKKRNQIISSAAGVYSSIRAEVALNGKRRIISLGADQIDSALIDITDDVEIGSDGHPVLGSLAEESKSIILALR